MKFEIELPRAGLPIDREVTGVRYGKPRRGDWSLNNSGKWEESNTDFQVCHQLIADLAPVEVWRPATVEDAIRALRGETVKCRAWDGNGNEKWKGILTGMIPDDIYPWGAKTDHGPSCYTNCEVLGTCK